jgi:hypothetical protein
MTPIEKKLANLIARYGCLMEKGSLDHGSFLLNVIEEEGERGHNVELTLYARTSEEAASAIFKLLEGLGMNSEAIARGLLRKCCREKGLYQDKDNQADDD